MALVSSTLATELKVLYKEMYNSKNPMSEEIFADRLAQAITKHIKTATVVGSCPNGSISGSLL